MFSHLHQFSLYSSYSIFYTLYQLLSSGVMPKSFILFVSLFSRSLSHVSFPVTLSPPSLFLSPPLQRTLVSPHPVPLPLPDGHRSPLPLPIRLPSLTPDGTPGDDAQGWAGGTAWGRLLVGDNMLSLRRRARSCVLRAGGDVSTGRRDHVGARRTDHPKVLGSMRCVSRPVMIWHLVTQDLYWYSVTQDLYWFRQRVLRPVGG